MPSLLSTLKSQTRHILSIKTLPLIQFSTDRFSFGCCLWHQSKHKASNSVKNKYTAVLYSLSDQHLHLSVFRSHQGTNNRGIRKTEYDTFQTQTVDPHLHLCVSFTLRGNKENRIRHISNPNRDPHLHLSIFHHSHQGTNNRGTRKTEYATYQTPNRGSTLTSLCVSFTPRNKQQGNKENRIHYILNPNRESTLSSLCVSSFTLRNKQQGNKSNRTWHISNPKQRISTATDPCRCVHRAAWCVHPGRYSWSSHPCSHTSQCHRCLVALHTHSHLGKVRQKGKLNVQDIKETLTEKQKKHSKRSRKVMICYISVS